MAAVMMMTYLKDGLDLEWLTKCFMKLQKVRTLFLGRLWWLFCPFQSQVSSQYFHHFASACCAQFFGVRGRECKIYDSVCEGVSATVPPTPAVPPPAPTPATTNSGGFYEGFEGLDLSLTQFTTDENRPWLFDDEHASSGELSLASFAVGQGQSSQLSLKTDFTEEGVLTYEVRHDVFMPWTKFEVKVDGEVIDRINGHAGPARWETMKLSLSAGPHDIVWDVSSPETPPPPNKRGEGKVWIDDVRYFTPVRFDFDDGTFDENYVSFSGLGEWAIDDSAPGGNGQLTAHSPQGLLPGEQSTMEIRWTSPSGGLITFDCLLGIGKISFYVDDELKFSEDRPARGKQEVEVIISPGEHVLSWKYEPPAQANLPLSMVWVDNVALT